MPIIDVSGLMLDEEEKKKIIRKNLKVFFHRKHGFSEDSTTVTFIEDVTTGPEEHVMARMYSKSFMKLDDTALEKLCDDVVIILEQAGHPFNEAFPIPVLAMKGRWKK
ncbi:hypothetical protein K8R32_04370 [bacterium]|nr:hypothetical protein [bacterium]